MYVHTHTIPIAIRMYSVVSSLLKLIFLNKAAFMRLYIFVSYLYITTFLKWSLKISKLKVIKYVYRVRQTATINCLNTKYLIYVATSKH